MSCLKAAAATQLHPIAVEKIRAPKLSNLPSFSREARNLLLLFKCENYHF